MLTIICFRFSVPRSRLPTPKARSPELGTMEHRNAFSRLWRRFSGYTPSTKASDTSHARLHIPIRNAKIPLELYR